ncbi:MAG: hypothetical protein INF88_00440 [Roseomonas sp.]|nr:hypothetical protein [Roseomonas sp.]
MYGLDGREKGQSPGLVTKNSQKIQPCALEQFDESGCSPDNVWETQGLKTKAKSNRNLDRKARESLSKRRIEASVVSKGIAKSNTAKAGKAAQSLEKPKKNSSHREKAIKPPKIRKEEFSFLVTPEFRKRFKKAAKEAGHKKADFLQILLARWQERNPAPAEAKA